tara:strand:- start:103 stop:354 length:252 start_codon:yes stop_codon:yes gene_type:complete
MCPRWYGYHSGVENLVISDDISDEKAFNLAMKNATEKSGSNSCKIYLLQQFQYSIKSVKNYPGMASIPNMVQNNERFIKNNLN